MFGIPALFLHTPASTIIWSSPLLPATTFGVTSNVYLSLLPVNAPFIPLFTVMLFSLKSTTSSVNVNVNFILSAFVVLFVIVFSFASAVIETCGDNVSINLAFVLSYPIPFTFKSKMFPNKSEISEFVFSTAHFKFNSP